ncbi:MAG: hypothetical protein ACPGFA_13170 [Pikeienuella sp.]
MTKSNVLAETTRLMEHARGLYRDLTEELIAAIDRLKADDDDKDAKTRSDTIKAHRKALQTILELEVQFLKQAEKGRDTHELDLEAARAEVMGRFRRLAEAGDD